VAIADGRFGRKGTTVVALLQPDVEPLATVRAHSEPLLAAYKLPRSVLVVDAIQHGPKGKPNYKRATAPAEKFLG
jgi:acyl-CoA synthetase (AMP-forming)/AMP-acid ligase II